MRIVAGKFGGRIIADTQGNNTHPMSEKIRGALFNSLGDIEGLNILDAFTGTGAVAIEAVSRGAASVRALDVDADAFKTASANVASLKLNSQIDVQRINVKAWSNRNQSTSFDIVIADMPFEEVNDRMLEKLHKHIKLNGLLVLNLPADFRPREYSYLEIVREKSYGDAKLEFYRRIS
ncbi:MAG: RsmD family RNA methyltransferase [bacterium]|nr:RsmD family RNA methyltransferase [bacterium]